jgi:hypothetical protein
MLSNVLLHYISSVFLTRLVDFPLTFWWNPNIITFNVSTNAVVPLVIWCQRSSSKSIIIYTYLIMMDYVDIYIHDRICIICEILTCILYNDLNLLLSLSAVPPASIITHISTPCYNLRFEQFNSAEWQVLSIPLNASLLEWQKSIIIIY